VTQAAALVSIVVPVLNEQQVLPAFYARLKAVLATLPDAAEVIFVDDGSSDRTPALLDEWAAADASIRVIHFSRNFGHQAALTAGLDHASGDAVVVIDADLQDPPELITQFHARWREGYQVVLGHRRSRRWPAQASDLSPVLRDVALPPTSKSSTAEILVDGPLGRTALKWLPG
jgi:dolichol-phosphate mannosyltransferase